MKKTIKTWCALFCLTIVAGNVIFASNDINKFYIECHPDSFQTMYENYSTDYYITITLHHNGSTWKNVRMRIRGDSSRNFKKKSLKLKFDAEPFVTGEDRLNFNADYLDLSYFNSVLSSYIFQQANQTAFLAKHALLYLNDEFLGIYVQIENMDEIFLNKRGMDENGNLYKATRDGACLSLNEDIENLWEKKANENGNWSDLHTLVDSLNLVPDSDFLRYIREQFNYEKLINSFALNMILSNGSTYYHNYYLYHDINVSNKWEYLPWDVDRTFHMYNYKHPIARSSSDWEKDNPLLERSIENEPMLADIRARIITLTDSLFNTERLSAVIDSLQTLLAPYIKLDSTDQIADAGQWQNVIDRTRNFIPRRPVEILKQIDRTPQNFKLIPVREIFTDTVTLRWHPTIDPLGGQISYSVYVSSRANFPDDLTTIYAAGNDTTITLPHLPSDGAYYWRVYASNAENTRNGYDSYNQFEVKRTSNIPASISGDFLLEKKNSPFIITENVNIEPGGKLVVEAGTELRMAPDVNINVYGIVSFGGQPQSRIKIQPLNTESGQWQGINFYQNAGSSILRYCDIERGGAGTEGALIYAEESALQLVNVTFKNNYGSVITQNGNLTINSNEVLGENKKPAFVLDGTSVKIKNSTFAKQDSLPAIIIMHGQNVQIDSCMFTGNGGEAIQFQDVDNASVSRSVFADYDQAIVSTSSSVNIDHTTFYAMHTAVDANSSTIEISNSIFSKINNTIYNQQNTTLSIDYSLSDTEQLSGRNNLIANPEFVAPESGNFYLKQPSPAIDRGNPDSPPDADGTITDIGAFTFITPTVVINEINYNSSPNFATEDWVELYNFGNAPLDISGWKFLDAENDHIYIVPENTVIASKDYIVLCENKTSFRAVHAEVENIVGNLGFGFDGGGELLRLYDTNGVIIDSLIYDDAAPWPEDPDGNGYTLELIEASSDNTDAQAWAASKKMGGTPGRKNDHSPTNENNNATRLLQNYPNPIYNANTTIPYFIDDIGRVEITIVNIKGQRVKTYDLGFVNPGYNEFECDFSHFPSGIYFYQLHFRGKVIATRKCMHIK